MDGPAAVCPGSARAVRRPGARSCGDGRVWGRGLQGGAAEAGGRRADRGRGGRPGGGGGRRRPGSAVRIALGARAPEVVRLLVRQGAMFAVGGVAIGLIVANGSTRLVASWLYGVGATDPMTFAAVAVAMIAVALAASWVPAYRASRTDAMEALRHD